MQRSVLAAAASAAILAASSASAAVNLVTNGSFEINAGTGQLGFDTTAMGWSVANPIVGGSYAFLFNPAAGVSGTSADTSGAVGTFGNTKIWGPDDGSANGLTLSPDGGAFISSDPAFQNSAITQTVNGLTAGTKYVLTFDWAGSQQLGHDGVTTEGWQVSLGGGPSQSTTLVTVLDKGFSGWMTQSFTFTADNSSDMLSFLALGGPGASQPPFALLDGVSLTAAAVPEPITWTLMLAGVGLLGGALRHRREPRPLPARSPASRVLVR